MKKIVSMLLMVFASVLFGPSVHSADYTINNTRSNMAEAMWDMMDWLRDGQRGHGVPFSGMGGFPEMNTPPSFSVQGPNHQPWKNSGDAPQKPLNPPTQEEKTSSSESVDWPVSRRLDGVWKGQSGEFFMIKGERFRLVAVSGDSLDGKIRIIGDRMQTYLPVTEQVRNYQFVKIGETMMMRDDTGQTLVFTRLQR